MAKKTYTITGSTEYIRHLERELLRWQVNPKLYQVTYSADAFEGVVTTRNANVVDVATETFMNFPHLIQIERN